LNNIIPYIQGLEHYTRTVYLETTYN
jgi:hypothetical protein